MLELLTIADDFGLHPDINEGILECAHHNRLTGLSVSTNGQAPDFSALRSIKNKTEIGIHLTLVGEPWLTQKKAFPNWKSLFTALLTKKISTTDIAIECQHQIQTLLAENITPTHIDSHQHVHIFPILWPIVQSLKTKFNIPRIRIPYAPNTHCTKHTPSGLALQLLAIPHKHQGLPCIGLRHSGHNTLDILKKELHSMPQIPCEWVGHPANQTNALENHYKDWHYNWKKEKNLLLSEQFLEILSTNNRTLRTFTVK